MKFVSRLPAYGACAYVCIARVTDQRPFILFVAKDQLKTWNGLVREALAQKNESLCIFITSSCASARLSPCWLWAAFCTWYHSALEKVFASAGRNIARNPRLTICLCLLFVFVCSLGFTRFKTENRAEKLYVPQESESMKDLDRGNKFFGLKHRQEFVIFEALSEDNVLTPQCLKEALEVHREIINLQSYPELCTTVSGEKAGSVESCLLLNPLEIFDFEEKNIINITSRIADAYNVGKRMRNGRPLMLNFPQLFGGVSKNGTAGKLVSARVMQFVYFMRAPAEDAGSADVIEWEKRFTNKVSSLAVRMTCVKIYYLAVRSVTDAISESSGSDVTLISVSFILMISFACFMLGKVNNPLTGHSLLASAGIFAVALGITSGFGLSLLFGIPFVSIVGVLPFLVIGIGIDDMFIIVDELDRHKPTDVTETVRLVLSHTGVTVTMTTITDLVAFAVSTSTQFPAIKYFCIYAALSLTFSYLMLITYFVAVMAFDVQRIRCGRRDCLPVCLAPRPNAGAQAWDEPRPQTLNKIMRAWARFLMLPSTKVVVVMASLVLLTVGIYGTTKVDQTFDRRVLAKDDSHFIEFVDIKDKYFVMSLPVNIIISGDVKYEDSTVQDDIRQLSKIVLNNAHYKNHTLSWMDSLAGFAEGQNISLSGASFKPALKKFLSIPAYSYFREDLKFSEDGQTIDACRIIAHMKESNESKFQRDAMVTLREDISRQSRLPAFAASWAFIYFEQYLIILSTTVQNLAIAATAILVITSPFLVDFTVIFLVFFGFVALIFELFGLMYFWGVSLNSVSMINLVMAMGFAVDYSAHIAHAFVTSDIETANERVIDALGTTGASVVMGGEELELKLQGVQSIDWLIGFRCAHARALLIMTSFADAVSLHDLS